MPLTQHTNIISEIRKLEVQERRAQQPTSNYIYLPASKILIVFRMLLNQNLAKKKKKSQSHDSPQSGSLISYQR